MSQYELLALLLALVAVVISAISLIRTGKLQRQQSRLNEVTEELSRKQLELITKEEAVKEQALVIADLEGYGSDWRFVITNEGLSPAENVEFELIDCPKSPLVTGDYNEKLPIPMLQPGQTVRLIAAIAQGNSLTYTARVSWTDSDGTRKKKEYFLSI